FYDSNFDEESIRAKVLAAEWDVHGTTRSPRRSHEDEKIRDAVRAEQLHLEHEKYEGVLVKLAASDVSPNDLVEATAILDFYNNTLHAEEVRAKVLATEWDVKGPTRVPRRSHEEDKIKDAVRAQQLHVEHEKYEEALGMLKEAGVTPKDVALVPAAIPSPLTPWDPPPFVPLAHLIRHNPPHPTPPSPPHRNPSFPTPPRPTM
ncbi:MAG: hypothetical protein SGPRY_011606, partial [Prymnesium sp.]